MPLDKEQLQAAAAGAKARVSDKLGDICWSLLVRGLLALALGIAAIFWPKATLELLVRLVGLYVLFDGIVSLFGAFRARELSAYLVPGLVSVERLDLSLGYRREQALIVGSQVQLVEWDPSLAAVVGTAVRTKAAIALHLLAAILTAFRGAFTGSLALGRLPAGLRTKALGLPSPPAGWNRRLANLTM